MIVCGSLNPDDELNNIIYNLHQFQDVCILSESTSNIYGDHIISCIDRTQKEYTEDQNFYLS